MVTFRKVTIEDVGILYNWLNTSHVKEFWDSKENFTYEQIYTKYDRRIKENKVKLYIIQKDSLDIGFIQTYLANDLTSYKIQGIAKGIDLYIGDINYLHKGYGKTILREFIKIFVFNDDSVLNVIIDPELKNEIAIKAYKKVGFVHVNTDYNQYEKAMTYYMVLSRDDFYCNL